MVLTTTVQACEQIKPQQSATSSDSNAFFWSYTEEPHRTRRQAIIKAHPEVASSDAVQVPRLTNFSGHEALRT